MTRKKLIPKHQKGGHFEYTVQPGDSLSTISKRITGSANNLYTLGAVNNIDDLDKIYVGLKLQIPEKFDKPLKLSQIPTNNELRIIDNYSNNFNYIIEGDKIYYSRKDRDHWVDISDNEKARKNLFDFIGNKYNFRGYDDDEINIWSQLKNGTYGKKEPQVVHPQVVHPQVNVLQFLKLNLLKPAKTDSLVAVPYRDPNHKYPDTSLNNSKKEKEENLSFLDKLSTMYENWKSRHHDEDDGELSNLPEPVDLDSNFGIRPGTFTGDTIYPFRHVRPNDRRYIVPESIDVTEFTFGARNRGQYLDINSEAAPITAFHPFKPYGKHDTNYKTYLGIDKNGKLKVGNIDLFTEGDMLTGTFSNDIVGFSKDTQGNYIYTQSKANRSRNQPVPILWNNGAPYVKLDGLAINILVNRGDKKGTYGNIVGGRVLVKVGDELRLLSGSVENIDLLFQEMKKRNNAQFGTFYTLDNGSYNIGLRTVDKKFTTKDLKEYDLRNTGGGNFLYITGFTPLSYRSDTIPTPNVRTVNDESYKKGHGLTNERLGILLHHTAFMDDDLTGVVKYLTNPKTQSSAHVVIGYDGTRKVLANPNQVTFHAGASVWNNRDNVNDFMIGLEFLGNTLVKDLTEDQIKSAVEYLKPIIRKNNIKLENITTHELVRNLYNDFAKKQKLKLAPSKSDINYKNYLRLLNALLKEVYYKK